MEAALVHVTHRGIGFDIAGFVGDHITEMMCVGRIYEADLLDAIYTRYGEGGVYYDFGAFIGTHTLFFAKACKADLVIAVEVNPDAFYLLVDNVKRNGVANAEMHNYAALEHSGRGRLVSRAGNHGSTDVRETSDIAGTFPIFASSAFISAKPKLIKIDAESSSIAILKGLLGVIREDKPVMVVEAVLENDFKVIDQLLMAMGYKYVNTYCASPTHIWEFANE